MARIYPLFSSSSGNSIYIGSQKCGVLIDAGVSCKRLCNALAQNGIEPTAVKAVFITHTHSDHIAGLKVFHKHYNTPVYAQEKNVQILCEKGTLGEPDASCLSAGEEIFADGFRVKAFTTHHDTPASCGYTVVTPDEKKAVICTDLGEITDEVSDSMVGADLVYLESNYDSNMLKLGSYPFELKMRIASAHGHLSNDDCGKQLEKLLSAGTNKFILGHLSRENNTPQLAEKSAVSALGNAVRNKDYLLSIAKPEGNGMAVAF